MATVAALAAENDEEAMKFLASENEVVRQGAAEGIHARGSRARLLEVASDPLVARIAVRAWSDPPVSPESINALMELEPSGGVPADIQQWTTSMNNVVAAMPSEAIVEVDELLADREEFFGARRLALRRAATTQEVEEAVRLAAAAQACRSPRGERTAIGGCSRVASGGGHFGITTWRGSLHCIAAWKRAGTKRQSFDRNQEPGSECS